MKKVIFGALGILLLTGVVGNVVSSSTATLGIQTSPTPTAIEIPTLEPTATPILEPIATNTPTVTPKPVYKAPTATPTTATTQSNGLSNDDYYTNVDGNQVHSPANSDSVPAGATAKCGDGTYSFSQHRSGTCSHHGGVAEWL